jgi:phosphoglucosamine mutase
MTRKLFGTDGIRGLANSEPMTAETALQVAMAAGRQFTRGDHRHLAVIGKDTRLSGYLLEPAMTAGFVSVGMDVVLLGPLPTPAVAMLTRSLRADLGVMISASHNPFQDNGIKFFGPDGYKLSDQVEAEIESRMPTNGTDLAPPDRLGRARRLDDEQGRYIEFVKATFPKRYRLDGLRVVIDCANGAAYKVGPTVLWELGAEVIPISVQPDGFNINLDCGATAPQALQAAVVQHGAHLGLALDGDADRLVMADETGRLIDGDQILAAVATAQLARDEIDGGGVVATVMSNMGLELYLAGLGLRLERTQVGDRYVVERMRMTGISLGGEQSGHLIFGRHATTGDGLIAALQMLAVLVESDKPASAFARLFEPVPQLSRSLRVGAGEPLGAPEVRAAISAAEARLGREGRIVVRRSGTEPIVRVMAEGHDARLVASVVEDIVGAVRRVAGE